MPALVDIAHFKAAFEQGNFRCSDAGLGHVVAPGCRHLEYSARYFMGEIFSYTHASRRGLDIIDGSVSTETSHIFLSHVPDDIRPGSSGKPFAGYELKIVDDDGHEVPQGEVGNLLVKGESAALFYLHQYERSHQTFQGKWLFTGDKYYVDEDGYYWHAGRSDDMLKVGGIWVSPVEVESTLIGHPAVLECAVVGKTDQSDRLRPQPFLI